MDYSSPPKFGNLLIILFSLLVFSQHLHFTLSQSDDPLDDPIDIHPDDKKVLLQIQKQLGNNTQKWTNITRCCVHFCFNRPMGCDFDGHVTSLALTFTTQTPSLIPSALGDLFFLKELVVSGPYFTGPIPKLPNLYLLKLDNTSIKGQIPLSLCGMKNLMSLMITNNKYITGGIPKALAKLTNLHTLHLSSNRLHGPIPAFLGRMSNLTWVLLHSNRFSGPIPASLGRLVNLAFLDLSRNQLTGSIPESFGSFNNSVQLLYLKLNNNRLTGSIPKAMARASMSMIDVSSNKLTDASYLFQNTKSGLFTINLSHNRLKFNFSKARFSTNLDSLDISHNMIYGSLPKQLGKLSLRSIDVSYNRLCGPIPASPVLTRFSPLYFAHNACLCGAPLSPCK